MAIDTTVMGHQSGITYSEKQVLQYQQAVANGFEGTIEQFLEYRDYT